MRKFWNYYGYILTGLISLTLCLFLLNAYHIIDLSPSLFTGFRLASILALAVYTVRKKTLTIWILFGIIAGAEFGYDLPDVAIKLQVLGDIFLRLIKTIIAPLLFATLVVGIAGHADLKQIGRIGWKSLLYFEVVSTIALFIGLIAINISKAGVGITLPEVTAGMQPVIEAQTPSGSNFLLHIFPENIAKAVFEGQMLQIVVFSILFGVALANVKEKHRAPMIRFTEGLAEVMFKFTNIIMYFAPVAVFGAIAYTIGHMGFDILFNLFKLLATLYVALFVFLGFVLIPIALFFRIPLVKFFQAVSKPATIAFATSNSESALPSAMENIERFGVPRKIVAFVIPTGYSFNLDGTTLYLSLATIFVAQAAGIDLPVSQQLLICLTLMLTSKGVAGVSRASLVVLLGTAATFGLPTEPIIIILGIDVLMDMARTAINVIGNCLATVVIARWEGEFDEKAARAFRNDVIE